MVPPNENNELLRRGAAKLGMWVFLATEILLFGGLFCAYAIYRAIHPEICLYAHQFLTYLEAAQNIAQPLSERDHVCNHYSTRASIAYAA